MSDFQIPETNWLRIPCKVDAPTFTYFRKKFKINELPASYIIKVSADSRYKLYINGKLMETGPSKGDDKVWYVDSVDIAPALAVGENAIAAEVLTYPLNGDYNHGIYRTKTPGLYIQDSNDSACNLSANKSYRCIVDTSFTLHAESPFFAPLYNLEKKEGNAALHGWKYADYDDGRWAEAQPYTILEISQSSVPGDLTERTIPYMYRQASAFTGVKKIRTSAIPEKDWSDFISSRKKLTLAPGSEHVVEFDANEELTGFLSLRLYGGKDARILVKTAEGYVVNDENADADLLFSHPKKADRADAENGVLFGFTDSYKAAGCGSEAFPEAYEPFWFRTFRYVQLSITVKDEPLVLEAFDYEKTGYPLEVISEVHTSDPTLDGIWDISLRSLKNCMYETYEDCPYYEQLQYAMDSRSQILYTYAISGDDRLARKCMDDFRRSQREDGMINSSYPTLRANVIPGFSIYYILMLDDHMMYFGDKDFLRKHLPAVDGILEYFRRHLTGQGLVGRTGGLNVVDRYWSFIDWTPEWNATTGVPDAILAGPITMESFLYVLGLQAAARINEYVGRQGMAEEYTSRAGAVKAAINTYCRGDNGFYQDGPGCEKYSQHGQVFAILTGTVSAEEGRRLLLETLANKDSYAQCSVAMSFYLFRALEKTGLYDKMNECWDLWRSMLKLNLTTCMEDNVKQRSDCHAWGASILYELPAVTLGVRPAAPGYEEIEVNPIPGYLTHASGKAATKNGVISVEWTRNDDGTLDVKKEYL